MRHHNDSKAGRVHAPPEVRIRSARKFVALPSHVFVELRRHAEAHVRDEIGVGQLVDHGARRAG